MNNKAVLYKVENNVMIIEFNKPDSLNAMDNEIKLGLSDALDEAKDNSNVKSIIITGRGRAFSAGGDLNSLANIKKSIEGRNRIKKQHELVRKIFYIEKPVIAAVNGYAVGAGCNIALACDIILASENAKFSEIFSKVGLIPDAGGLYFLPRLIGPAKAKEMIFSGRMVNADEAERIGLINRVVPKDELIKEAKKHAETYAKGPSIAIGFSKLLVNKSLGWDLETLLENEAAHQGICMETLDFKEGVNAFKEKRGPNFKGE